MLTAACLTAACLTATCRPPEALSTLYQTWSTMSCSRSRTRRASSYWAALKRVCRAGWTSTRLAIHSRSVLRSQATARLPNNHWLSAVVLILYIVCHYGIEIQGKTIIVVIGGSSSLPSIICFHPFPVVIFMLALHIGSKHDVVFPQIPRVVILYVPQLGCRTVRLNEKMRQRCVDV